MHHTRGFMTRLSSHNRQKSSKSPAGRKTQKNTVSFSWVLVIQMTYKAGNALIDIPRAQKCPKTPLLGGASESEISQRKNVAPRRGGEGSKAFGLQLPSFVVARVSLGGLGVVLGRVPSHVQHQLG